MVAVGEVFDIEARGARPVTAPTAREKALNNARNTRRDKAKRDAWLASLMVPGVTPTSTLEMAREWEAKGWKNRARRLLEVWKSKSPRARK